MHQEKPVAVCGEICGWQQVLFFVRKVKKSGTRTPWNSREVVSVTNSDASAWVVYGLGNNGYEIKLSSAADNSAPVLGTVTADNQN